MPGHPLVKNLLYIKRQLALSSIQVLKLQCSKHTFTNSSSSHPNIHEPVLITHMPEFLGSGDSWYTFCRLNSVPLDSIFLVWCNLSCRRSFQLCTTWLVWHHLPQAESSTPPLSKHVVTGNTCCFLASSHKRRNHKLVLLASRIELTNSRSMC